MDGAQGGTQTHESTDLQSAPLVALVPVRWLVAGVGIEPTSFWLMRPASYPELYPAIILAETERFELSVPIT